MSIEDRFAAMTRARAYRAAQDAVELELAGAVHAEPAPAGEAEDGVVVIGGIALAEGPNPTDGDAVEGEADLARAYTGEYTGEDTEPGDETVTPCMERGEGCLGRGALSTGMCAPCLRALAEEIDPQYGYAHMGLEGRDPAATVGRYDRRTDDRGVAEVGREAHEALVEAEVS